MGRWYLATNVHDIKECDALELNKTIAGCELASVLMSLVAYLDN
jgi:hypothetical protein